MSISGRSSFSCIQTTFASLRGSSFAAAAFAALSSGFSTRYLVIFLSILMDMVVTPATLLVAYVVAAGNWLLATGQNPVQAPSNSISILFTGYRLLVCSGQMPVASSRSPAASSSELAVVPLFHCVEQIRGAVHFAVVLDLFVAFHFHFGAVFEREHIGRVLQVFLFHQHALERFGVEAERRAAFETLLVGLEV